jgi:tetratricopeptide (TPR) repeat protein
MKPSSRETTCPSSASWYRLLDDSLSEDDRVELLDHAKACGACRAFLADWSGQSHWGDDLSTISTDSETFDERHLISQDDSLEVGESDDPQPENRGRPSLDEQDLPDIDGYADWKLIGRGAMGLVYRAREVELGRTVAIKVLSVSGRIAPSSRARVLREARTLARLKHPNVISLFGSGDTDGVPYLVMEHIDGGSLQDQLTAGPMGIREAARIVRDIARAVGEAHTIGIIHRDLKPSNVLMATDANSQKKIPKLADFGLARVMDDASQLSQTERAVGTPCYMAPEQTGLTPSAGVVGPAADIHGLGAILYALLTGKPPYLGASEWETLTNVAGGRIESLRTARSGVPRDLEAIMTKCLEVSPRLRYRLASDVADDLGRFLDGRTVKARPVSPDVRLAKWVRRHPAFAVAAVMAMGFAISMISVTYYYVVMLRQANQLLTVESRRATNSLRSAAHARHRLEVALSTLTDERIERMLGHGQHLNEEDQRFLEKVRLCYTDSTELGALEDVESLKFRARGLLKVGEICRRTMRFETAHAAFESAIELFDQAQKPVYSDPDAAKDHIEALESLGLTCGAESKTEEAIRLFRSAVEARKLLSKGSLEEQLQLVNSIDRLAYWVGENSQRAEAETLRSDALSTVDRLRHEYPADVRLVYLVCQIQHNRALNFRAADQTHQLTHVANESLKFLQDEGKPQMSAKEYYGFQVAFLNVLIDSHLDHEEVAAAEPLYQQKSRVLREALKDVKQRYLEDQKLLWNAWQGYRICKRKGDWKPAESELRDAIDAGMEHVKASPATYEHYRLLTFCMGLLGEGYESSKEYEKAIRLFAEQQAICFPWIKEKKADQVIRFQVATGMRSSARIMSKLGRFDEAIAKLELAVNYALENDRPAVLIELGQARLAVGQFESARKVAEEALAFSQVEQAARELLRKILERTAAGAR